MKQALAACILLFLSSCAQTGYQPSYIISDTAKDQKIPSAQESELPR